MRAKTVLRQLETLRNQIELYQAALQKIRDLGDATREPEAEDYDDTESAYSNGIDVGYYEARKEVAQIAREALQ